MINKILTVAEQNTEAVANNPLAVCREIKLASFDDLLDVSQHMSEATRQAMTEQRQCIEAEIAQGVTFAFWFDGNMLVFER